MTKKYERFFTEAKGKVIPELYNFIMDYIEKQKQSYLRKGIPWKNELGALGSYEYIIDEAIGKHFNMSFSDMADKYIEFNPMNRRASFIKALKDYYGVDVYNQAVKDNRRRRRK